MQKNNHTTSTIVIMSIPIFIELLLQLLVGNIDQFMISQYSQDSVAAIGNGNQVMNIAIIVLNAMSLATTVLLAQYLGAQDKRKISQICTVSVLVITVASVIAGALMVGLNQPLFSWMNVPHSVIDEACLYLKIVGSMILIQGLYMTMTAILRSYSLLKEVMISAIIMNVLNIVGNAILINGLFGFPQLGIIGAGISTNISKCIGLAFVCWLFIKKVEAKISWKVMKPFPVEILKKLLMVGLPSGGQELSYNLSQMIILKFINIFGTAVIATKVYASMLANVAYVYSMAISQATQIIVGYLMGAHEYEQAEKRVWLTCGISIIISLSITLIIYLNSEIIFGLFTTDLTIIRLGKQIIFIEFFLEFGRAINIVMTRCLVATGDVTFPVTVSLIGCWGVAVGLGYILGVHLGYGLVGIWIAMAIDECLRGIIFMIRFKSGVWKGKALVEPILEDLSEAVIA